MRTQTLIAIGLALVIPAAPAIAQEIDAPTQAALDAIAQRCPTIRATMCRMDADPADDEEPASLVGTLTGDQAQITADCSAGGNGGSYTHIFVYDVDLAHCRATMTYRGHEQARLAMFDSAFQVFGLTDPARTPLPSPPGVLFRPGDPAFAATQLALTPPPARATITRGRFVVSSPRLAVQAPIPGLPTAEPAAYLSVTELHAIGAPPSSRPSGPGRFLRAFRLTAGVPAPREVFRSGDYTVLGGSVCVAVVHRPTSTYRRVLCGEADITWVGGDGAVAIGLAETESTEERLLLALDLASGTAHEVALVPRVDEDDGIYDDAVHVRRGALVIDGEPPHRIRLAELLTAMRASVAAPAPAPSADVDAGAPPPH